MMTWKLTYMSHGNISDLTCRGETLADVMRLRHLDADQVIGCTSRLAGRFSRPVIKRQRDQESTT
jgi:hypothetical protein